MQHARRDAGFHGAVLTLVAGGQPGVFEAGLPPGAPGQWCRLTVQVTEGAPGSASAPLQQYRWWVKLEAVDEARGHVVRESFLGRLRGPPGRRWRSTLLHLPAEARALTLRMFTADPAVQPIPTARLDMLTRRQAAVALLTHGWRILPGALAGDLAGLPGRVRVMLGQAPARAGEAPPYSVWIGSYDAWPPYLRAALLSQAGQQASVEIVVAGAGSIDESLASARDQWLPAAAVTRVTRPAEWQPAGTEWVLILQEGEVLAPQALACFAQAIRKQPDALGFYADLDQLVAGVRCAPLFKPVCDPWLLPSGLLTAGACVFRKDHAAPGAAADGAEWRLAAASGVPPDAFRRLPLLLTHVKTAVKPNRMRVPQGMRQPPVTLVIPSSGRSAHALRCLKQLLANTHYPGMDVLVAVSNADPGDAVQRAHLRQMSALPAVRVLELGMTRFNYAAVNNAAVRQASGELVLLLNDDVVPIEPTWLQRMVAILEAPHPRNADIVGARLLYGNNRVQHGGVVMGLANLCEHAFRLSSRDEAGPHGIALLDRQVSAVTGACMLLRRCLYETVGGMDEAFAVALNDVDFCLRASHAGARIVFAAGVELYHYESLSLGRHYEGSRAGLEALEVGRLRQRWLSTIADDPFYSPLASLEPGREFCPAFPPRATPLSWTVGETAGQG